jgi:hypothetical protein
MKTLIAAFILTLVLGFLTTAPAIAQTSSEETVCEPLKADGITKGLYGLCVAFCEAQEWASIEVAISEGDLEALASEGPSSRILTKYNKKKQESDPGMPCILVEEPCPCWTADELASIDGYNSDGISITTQCTPPTSWPYFREARESDPINVAYATPGISGLCIYYNVETEVFRFLTEDGGSGGITVEESADCHAQVEAQCAALGF